MNSENTIRKSVQVISVIALLVGASGCATQSTGGSKLSHQEVMQQNQNDKLVRVCNQFGAKMHCSYQDREEVQRELDYLDDLHRR